MNRKLSIALGILLMVVLGVTLWQMLSREPSYNGKPLSYWIDPGRTNINPEELSVAVAAMGDKAVPFLVKRLRSKPSPVVQLLSRWFPAFPPLARYMQKALGKRQIAIFALGRLRIRQESLLPFIDKLKDTSDPGWFECCVLMYNLGTNAAAAVPNLIAALEITTNVNNTMIRANAFQALRSIHSRPELCVPALAAILRSPDPLMRQMALFALVGFGSAAKPAWAEILDCLGDPDRWTRETAANLLKKIDAEAAAKAGVK